MAELSQDRRAEKLADLLRLRVPMPIAVAAVKELPWESGNDVVTLTAADVVRVLNRYLGGELSVEDVETWADAIEAREDIGFMNGDEELLQRFVFEVANPELSEPMSRPCALRWLDVLAGQETAHGRRAADRQLPT